MDSYHSRSQRGRASAALASFTTQPYASSSQQTFVARPDSQVYPIPDYPAKAYQSQITLSEPEVQKESVGTHPSPLPAKKGQKQLHAVISHLKNHVGVGIVCAVAYFDPGNWSVDLAAGSLFGYKLLFMIMFAGIGAMVLQSLACKMGVITGLDLAQHTRLLLYNHPKHPRLVRYLCHYPLYFLAEAAIVSTDLAELLGTAVGISLLFPGIPLVTAVLLTSLDVVIIMLIGDPGGAQGRPQKVFETFIIVLVVVVFICFFILLVKVQPEWSEVFLGYLPNSALIDPQGLFISIGIIGATVMPHGLFLGSHMATKDRVSKPPRGESLPALARKNVPSTYMKTLKSFINVHKMQPDEIGVDTVSPHGVRENNSFSFVKGHLVHSLVDLIASLLGFAVTINSAILIVAGAVFFFGPGRLEDGVPAGLFDAHALITNLLGGPFAFFFALALFCSGQSAGITATLAGQVIGEGFMNWKISPVLRRVITRFLGIIPSAIFAAKLGRSGIDQLLVISQVILSIVLPFVTFPLIYVTSSRKAMRVRKPTKENISEKKPGSYVDFQVQSFTDSLSGSTESGTTSKEPKSTFEHGTIRPSQRRGTELTLTSDVNSDNDDDFYDYSNGWFLASVAYLIWFAVLCANMYSLYQIGSGQA